jgi:hypothetical protein
VITEYALRIDGQVVLLDDGATLADYERIAERDNGQVVFRLVGEWQDYTGERSDPNTSHEPTEQPNWQTKIVCACGYQAANWMDFYRHRGDAYRASTAGDIHR